MLDEISIGDVNRFFSQGIMSLIGKLPAEERSFLQGYS
jgi:hypothetical protein